MTRKQRVDAWVNLAVRDFDVMYNSLRKGRNNYNALALYMGQQALEKLFKAIIEARGIQPPFTHKLDVLATNIGLNLNPQQLKNLVHITEYNQKGRYDDSTYSFIIMCTEKYTKQAVQEITVWYKKLRQFVAVERAKIPNGTK